MMINKIKEINIIKINFKNLLNKTLRLEQKY